ncbi:MAG TPA: DUF554 domain-containing protein [Acidimicrobiia bacterium]|nr:DUF554 domain-containing protein [Acidimicrobiia bacterium]
MNLPIGTIANVATVIVGTVIGALAGRRFPESLRGTVMATLGLSTAAIGVRELLPTQEFPLVLGAVLVGTVIGELLRIEAGLHRLGESLQRRFTPVAAVTEVEVPEVVAPVAHRSRFGEGFVVASLVFCVGPLTIVGSIQDGLGDSELLLIKAALDGFASIAFAAVYGWGVMAAALTVLVIQGGIALAAGTLDGLLTDEMVDGLGAAGGIMLLGISLRLLDLKQVKVANMLPAVVVAPLFVKWWG